MKRKNAKRLNLNKETIECLNLEDYDNVRGGCTAQTVITAPVAGERILVEEPSTEVVPQMVVHCDPSCNTGSTCTE